MHIVDRNIEPFSLQSLKKLWPAESTLIGVTLFGSRGTMEDKPVPENADWDIGIIYDGPVPHIKTPPKWDLFLWSRKHWQSGFVLQLELARGSQTVFDPEGIVNNRLDDLRRNVTPHYVRYLRRL